jgi:hypothetical protein
LYCIVLYCIVLDCHSYLQRHSLSIFHLSDGW